MATIAKLKGVVHQFSPESARQGKMSVDGFVVIHQFLVQNSKFQAVWELLSAYGYGPDLLLAKDYLHPKYASAPLLHAAFGELTVHSIDFHEGNVTQLGPKGFRFLMEQFERFDADRDGLLNAQEQKELYETAPSDPFRFKGPLMCETSAEAPEAITEAGLLALWWYVTARIGTVTRQLTQSSMKTHLSYKFTSKYLRFLSYKGPMKEAIDVLPGKRGSNVQREYRHTYQCFLFGSGGCGKSAVLRSLVGKAHTAPVDPFVVNAVHKERSGGSKFLIV